MKQVNSFKTDDFDFDLPEELIAQVPLKNRSASRLMVLDHQQQTIEDKTFLDIIDELQPNDALVMNNTRVLPARLFGTKTVTGAHLEVLLLHNTEGARREPLRIPAKKANVGTPITFRDGRSTAEVVEVVEEGGRSLDFAYDGIFL